MLLSVPEECSFQFSGWQRFASCQQCWFGCLHGSLLFRCPTFTALLHLLTGFFGQMSMRWHSSVLTYIYNIDAWVASQRCELFTGECWPAQMFVLMQGHDLSRLYTLDKNTLVECASTLHLPYYCDVQKRMASNKLVNVSAKENRINLLTWLICTFQNFSLSLSLPRLFVLFSWQWLQYATFT